MCAGLDREQRIEQRHVGDTTDAVLLAGVQAGQQRPGGVEAGGDVAEGLAQQGRRSVGRAGGLHDPRQRLSDDVVRRPRRPGPGLPETGDADVDESGISRAQRLGVYTQSRRHARSEILHHGIAGGRQVHRQTLPRITLQIQHHRSLAAVGEQEVRPVLSPHRSDPPVVVALGRLDLDDVGAGIGQQCGAEWPGEDAREIEDAQTGERRGEGHEL